MPTPHPLDPAPEALALAELTPHERELLQMLAGNCAFRVRNGYRRRGDARTIRLDTVSRLVHRGLLQHRPIRGTPAVILTQAAHAALAMRGRAPRAA